MEQLDRRVLGVLLVLMAVLPPLCDDYTLHILIVSCFYILMACSWNMVAGYSGQFSFAHTATATAGAYVSGLLAVKLGLSPFLGLVLGGLTGGLIGLILGSITLRMSGSYLALTTLGFAEIFRMVASIEYKITNGNIGLSVPGFFADTAPKIFYYYLGFALVLLVLAALAWLVSSNTGLTIRAIREDEIGAAVMGARIFRHKIIIFTLASAIAGTAGVFLAHYNTLVSPASATISQMGLVIAMTVIGGMGSFSGPVVGAILVEVISEYVRQFGDYHMVIFGFLLLVILRFSPEGLHGTAKRVYNQAKRAKRVTVEP